ncbi:hypothetical protein [Bacillus sp. FSL K6-3431]|uniref:hypothetical protein n=1 Tax=Bacillus sp. FSL K6-3431 TaxID=2921500 RepID=UPI0030F6E218
MIMSIIAPVLIMGLLAISVVLIIRSKNKYMKNKRVTMTFLGSYLTILCISAIVYGLLPVENANIHAITEKEVNRISDVFNENIFSGKTENMDPAFIKDEWTLDYDKDKLTILQPEGYFDGMIVIERKPEDDEKIEGTYYANAIIGGVDVTPEIIPTKVDLNGDTLELIIPAMVELKFSLTKKEFPINQFTEEGRFKRNPSSFTENQLLYLRIPQNLEIINNQDLFIHYVEE